MLRFGLAAAALLAAAPALAQPATGAAPQGGADMTPPPAFMQAVQGLGECVENSVQAAAATVAPETVAAQALSSCGPQRAALDAAFEAWVASPAFPEAGKAIAREQFRTRMAGAPAALTEDIRRRRSAPASPNR